MDNNKIKQGKPTKKHMTIKKLNKYVLYELKTRNKMQNIICVPKTKSVRGTAVMLLSIEGLSLKLTFDCD